MFLIKGFFNRSYKSGQTILTTENSKYKNSVGFI